MEYITGPVNDSSPLDRYLTSFGMTGRTINNNGDEGGGEAAAFISPSLPKANVIPNGVRNLSEGERPSRRRYRSPQGGLSHRRPDHIIHQVEASTGAQVMQSTVWISPPTACSFNLHVGFHPFNAIGEIPSVESSAGAQFIQFLGGILPTQLQLCNSWVGFYQSNSDYTIPGWDFTNPTPIIQFLGGILPTQLQLYNSWVGFYQPNSNYTIPGWDFTLLTPLEVSHFGNAPTALKSHDTPEERSGELKVGGNNIRKGVIASPCYKNQTRENDGVIIGNMYATKWQNILARGAALGKDGNNEKFRAETTYNMPSLQDSNTCSASITPGLRPGLRYFAASRRSQTGSVFGSAAKQSGREHIRCRYLRLRNDAEGRRHCEIPRCARNVPANNNRERKAAIGITMQPA